MLNSDSHPFLPQRARGWVFTKMDRFLPYIHCSPSSSVIVLFLICASSVLDVRSLDSNSLCVYVVALQNVLCLVCH
jgi:hypothetical protein